LGLIRAARRTGKKGDDDGYTNAMFHVDTFLGEII
jgi:hypothetical protein